MFMELSCIFLGIFLQSHLGHIRKLDPNDCSSYLATTRKYPRAHCYPCPHSSEVDVLSHTIPFQWETGASPVSSAYLVLYKNAL